MTISLTPGYIPPKPYRRDASGKFLTGGVGTKLRESIQCDRCGETFSTLGGLSLHRNGAIGNRDGMITFTPCDGRSKAARMAASQRRWQKTDRGKASLRKSRRNRERKIRRRAELLLGGSCQLCGSISRLEFGHILYAADSVRNGKRTPTNRSIAEEVIHHPERFLLLCFECHRHPEKYLKELIALKDAGLWTNTHA